jgi:hypothetical protein
MEEHVARLEDQLVVMTIDRVVATIVLTLS